MDKAKDFEKGWEEYKAKKKQEIEEMEKDIVRSEGLDVHGKAKYLYDLGYRKIPENAVVLTREELADMKFTQEHCDLYLENKWLKECIPLARKETVEKLLDEIDYESNGQTKSITDLLRKKYGV